MKGSESRVHEVKCWPQYYEAAVMGHKPFELRKNDRDYRIRDHLVLCAWDPMTQEFIGPRATFEITYILAGDGFVLGPDMCVLGIKPLNSHAGAE